MLDGKKLTTPEVVFVLRVRAGDGGWWGQVQRLDGVSSGSLRYVAGLRDLYSLLESDWQTTFTQDSEGEKQCSS